MLKCHCHGGNRDSKSQPGLLQKSLVPRKSCEGCTAGTCKPDEQSMEIDAVNKAGAKAGQRGQGCHKVIHISQRFHARLRHSCNSSDCRRGSWQKKFSAVSLKIQTPTYCQQYSVSGLF